MSTGFFDDSWLVQPTLDNPPPSPPPPSSPPPPPPDGTSHVHEDAYAPIRVIFRGFRRMFVGNGRYDRGGRGRGAVQDGEPRRPVHAVPPHPPTCLDESPPRSIKCAVLSCGFPRFWGGLKGEEEGDAVSVLFRGFPHMFWRLVGRGGKGRDA